MALLKEMIFGAVVFLAFFGMLIFSGIYSDTLRMECREKAMEKPYTSAEIQVICK
jgi:hypothetical protein